ncbi:MAG: helix-hairpin-helix domain-containing protein [Nanoarchaeota archaeon]|nr:helix-hairpin-helix domain-containing protein [Nanoarchaeota archaeon]
MRKLILGILFILLLQNISATCEDNQVDINAASSTELDKIIWVGPSTAEKIISARPFESVDDLTKVSGIGEVKILDIKEQGIACVGSETQEEEKEKINLKDVEIYAEKNYSEQDNSPPEVINLNPKTIKTENNTESSDKNKYALRGFAFFCVLLVFLFVFKIRRDKVNKNEFRD